MKDDESDNLETPKMCFSSRHHIVTSWLVMSTRGRPELHRPVVALDSWLRAHHRGKSFAAGSRWSWIDHDHRDVIGCYLYVCNYTVHVVLRGSTFHTYCFCVCVCDISFDFVSPLCLFLHLPIPVHTAVQSTYPCHGGNKAVSCESQVFEPMNLCVFRVAQQQTNAKVGEQGTHQSSMAEIVIQTFTFLLQLSYITNELVASWKQKAPEVQNYDDYGNVFAGSCSFVEHWFCRLAHSLHLGLGRVKERIPHSLRMPCQVKEYGLLKVEISPLTW